MMKVLLLLLFLIPPSMGGGISQFPPRTRYFNATLDHFSFSNKQNTFQQKYLIYEKFWKETAGPLFFFFGGEGDVNDFYDASGAVFELARDFGALVVFLEHRYYGSTLPFGNKSYDTNNELRFLTVEQSLADTALFLSNKETLFGCSKEGCETVLFGGSYGGMLVAWFRLKYPHLSVGGVAASAPVDFWPGENKQKAFFNATMNTFEKFGGAENCSKKIEQALDEIVQLSQTANGRQRLQDIFHTCSSLPAADRFGEKLQFYLKGGLATMAMLDYPYQCGFVSEMPANPVQVACRRMMNASSAIEGLHDAVGVFTNFTGSLACADVEAELVFGPGRHLHSVRKANREGLGSIERPWNYQACTELILEPLTTDGLGFYAPDASQISGTAKSCAVEFSGVRGRYNWLRHSFGDGIDLARNLKNVFFSDGEKDPWRVGSVPDNSQQLSSDGSVLHYLMEGGAHHQDLRFSSTDDAVGVLKCRALEKESIRKWLMKTK